MLSLCTSITIRQICGLVHRASLFVAIGFGDKQAVVVEMVGHGCNPTALKISLVATYPEL